MKLTTNSEVEELLEAWEATYKKGQLTLWIFMALREGEKYVDEIKSFIESQSHGTISCEMQSLYRALRKFEHIDVLAFHLREGNKGPERKYYYLTQTGEALFEAFVERNIKLFFGEDIKRLLNL